MSLPRLTLDPRLAESWTRILQEKGVVVRRDEAEVAKQQGKVAVRALETPWLVQIGEDTARILEVCYVGRESGDHYLVFMPSQTSPDKGVWRVVYNVLHEAGARED
jgi:hypothetical protein